MKHRNWSILEVLDDAGKTAFMAGGNVTVDAIHQFDETTKGLTRWYVAKVRGITVSDQGRYKFETAEEARAFGDELREYWRSQLPDAAPEPADVGGQE